MASEQPQPLAFQHNPRLLELLTKSKQGCDQSLGELLSEYRPFLLQIANQRLPNSVQSKLGGSDIVQQSFLNASHAFNQFQGETIEELTAWLVRIVVNHTYSAQRHFNADKRNTDKEVPIYQDRVASDQSRGRDREVLSNESTPSQRIMSEERRQLIDRALACLSAEHRLVLELRIQNELTFAEIGAILQCSADAARKLWARAAETLAKALRSMDESR